MSGSRAHSYRIDLEWRGNCGTGTSEYRAYSREYAIAGPGKPELIGSADPAFLGDASHYNPEDLLVASLSACHMLWYLHLCADAGVTVTAYRDDAGGTMEKVADGGIAFTEVVLAPRVTVSPDSDRERAAALHEDAHARCFIARSVNFPVRCRPEIEVAG
ncbi:OsmC family protein [Arhodomonas sp. AD133]|uniref:OsmC family protein n=1 Tax=Arhodomonas sp. AD133 TaxID=3415009 RepID=UPI003EBB79DB